MFSQDQNALDKSDLVAQRELRYESNVLMIATLEELS